MKAGKVKKPKLGAVANINKNNTNNFIFISIFVILYTILFLFLRNKILFTPDFGESDAYHLNFSLKYFLAQNYRTNQLPFWTDKLQGGFPLLAEGQIGALFLPNIFFLKFFNFADGYNLLLIFSLFLLTLGFYLLLKEFRVNSWLALLFSLIFTFSGAISLRWVHLNLIQSFSLTPFLFLFLLKYLKTNKFRYIFICQFIISQMIFAGYIPIVFISVFGLSLFYLAQLNYKFFNFRYFLIKIRPLFFLYFGSILLAAPQLLPTYILTSQSERHIANSFQAVTAFPFNYEHVLSYILPFPFGNPKYATYPSFSDNWGIFWENTPYLSIPFFIILITSFGLFFMIKRKVILKRYFLITLFLLLLAFGKYSPLYFIFEMPPFNFFRTQSRYLIIVNFFLVFITAIITSAIYQNITSKVYRVALLIALILNIVLLIKFTFSYHLFINKNQALEKPEMAKYLDDSLYLTLDQVSDWNKVLFKNGWSNKESINTYLFFKNYLYPNLNLVFNKKSLGFNTGGFRLKRLVFLTELIGDLASDQLTIDKKYLNLTEILGLKYIITDKDIKNKNYKTIKTVIDAKGKIFLHENKTLENQAYYIPARIKKITYLEEFKDEYENDRFSTENSLVENTNMVNTFINASKPDVKTLSDKDDHLILKGDFKDKTFIVFRKNYYPEWSLYVDEVKTAPIKTNLVHIGAFISKGRHKIELKYTASSFKLGSMIATVYVIVLLLIRYLKKRLKKSSDRIYTY